eukprot:scaffold195966_cov17-Tisochrysis_lutea.AAC.2
MLPFLATWHANIWQLAVSYSYDGNFSLHSDNDRANKQGNVYRKEHLRVRDPEHELPSSAVIDEESWALCNSCLEGMMQ